MFFFTVSSQRHPFGGLEMIFGIIIGEDLVFQLSMLHKLMNLCNEQGEFYPPMRHHAFPKTLGTFTQHLNYHS